MQVHSRIALAALVGLAAFVPTADSMRFTTRPAAWPDSWPKELESIRRQSWTHEGGFPTQNIHEIPLRSLAEFEKYLPFILSLRSNGSPIAIGRLSRPTKSEEPINVAMIRVLAPSASTFCGYPPMLDEAGNRISSERVELWFRREALSEEDVALLDMETIVGAVERIDSEAMKGLKANTHFILMGPPWPDEVIDESGNLPEFVHTELVDSTLTWIAGPEAKHGIGVRARVDLEIYLDENIIGVDELNLPADAEIIDKMRFSF